jgi:hypothetical protein
VRHRGVQTLCGRGVSSILIILGITGTSLVISKVQDALHMTPQQQTVMRMIAEKKRDERIMLLSVLAIQKTWKTCVWREPSRPPQHICLPAFAVQYSPLPVGLRARG